MKKQSMYLHAGLIVMLAVLEIGCSGGGSGFGTSASSDSTVNLGSLTISPTGSTGTSSASNLGVTMLSGYGGSAVTFTPDSTAALTNYVETHPLNAPSNYAISVNLQNQGSQQFGGTVMFTYEDNGQWYTSQLVTGNTTAQTSGNGWYTGMNSAAFNTWFTYGGNQVFHGFFQDALGSVVLVLDGTGSGVGDGLSSGTYNGSLWFKNFTPTSATQSPLMCWFIEIGPYDCQTFLVNGRVQPTSALYPSSSDGYQRLGTFTGLNIQSAFNQ